MRIEDVTAETDLGVVGDRELLSLKARANQVYGATREWAEQIRGRMVGVSQPIAKDRLMEAYSAVLAEVGRRGLPSRDGPLDHKVYRRRLRGFDAEDLPPILVKGPAVALAGGFVEDPRGAGSVDVRIDASGLEPEFADALERRMIEGVLGQVDKPAVVKRDAEGLGGPAVALYDLVLVPSGAEADVEGLRKALAGPGPRDLPAEGAATLKTEGGLTGEMISCSPTIHSCAPTPVADEYETKSEGPMLAYISKPLPSEHAARQLPPTGEMRRQNDKFGPGIHAIWSIVGGKTKLQSIRFDASKFTVAQAKAWLKEHNRKTGVEPARPKVKKAGAGFVKSEMERIVGGIVYAPHQVDSQGDFCESADIWEGLKSWMLKGHPMRFMHGGRVIDTPLVECFQADADTRKGGTEIPSGAWYIAAHVPANQEGLWGAIMKGEITGFSMAGVAGEVETMEDE
jgi:hypothetical protein